MFCKDFVKRGNDKTGTWRIRKTTVSKQEWAVEAVEKNCFDRLTMEENGKINETDYVSTSNGWETGICQEADYQNREDCIRKETRPASFGV